jgi:hypothetical protein
MPTTLAPALHDALAGLGDAPRHLADVAPDQRQPAEDVEALADLGQGLTDARHVVAQVGLPADVDGDEDAQHDPDDDVRDQQDVEQPHRLRAEEPMTAHRTSFRDRPTVAHRTGGVAAPGNADRAERGAAR